MLGNLLKPEFDELIRAKDWASLREAFTEMDPADIAEVIEDLPAEDSGVLFRLLPRDMAAHVFEYLPLDQQSEVVSTLATEQLANLLNEMAPDDRTRLFEELPAEVTKRALTHAEPRRAEDRPPAARLPGEVSAGRYMTPEYLTLRPNDRARGARPHARARPGAARRSTSSTSSTSKGVLLDDVRLATLVLAEPDAKVDGHRTTASWSASRPPRTAKRSSAASRSTTASRCR